MRDPNGARTLCVLAILGVVAGGVPASAQTESAEAANRALVAAFESTISKRDFAAWGSLFTDDVDCVGTTGWAVKGRDEAVKDHMESHAGPLFKDSVFSVQRVKVAFLRPDVGLLHVDWRLKGAQYSDGKPGTEYEGVLTFVTVKDRSTWKIRAYHNSKHDLDE